jgi:hypothetical protein
MKIFLCPDCGTKQCPSVEIKEDSVVIGEYDNICTLTRKQFDILKEKILRNEI